MKIIEIELTNNRITRLKNAYEIFAGGVKYKLGDSIPTAYLPSLLVDARYQVVWQLVPDSYVIAK